MWDDEVNVIARIQPHRITVRIIFPITDRYAYDLPKLYILQFDEEHVRFGDDWAGHTASFFREDEAAFMMFNTIFEQLDLVYHDRADVKMGS